MTGKVLCISSGAVARLYYAQKEPWFCADKDELRLFERTVRLSSFFVDRNRAEHDCGLVQLIPVCVISNGLRILCVERAKNAARLELRSKWTAVFGGHVDDSDDTGTDRWQTIQTGAFREVREELGIEVASPLEFAGLAIDPTNKMGRLHLGIIFFVPSELDKVPLSDGLDLDEFNVAASSAMHLFSPSELFRVQDRFDPWSTLFFRSAYAHRHLRPDPFQDADLPLLQAAQ